MSAAGTFWPSICSCGLGTPRRLDLDDELRDARLDLRELALGLIDGGLERRRGARRQRRPQHRAVGLRRLDQAPERRLALGDAEQVGRRGEDLLGALELVERLGELARALELVALLEQFAGGGALGVADLGEGWSHAQMRRK